MSEPNTKPDNLLGTTDSLEAVGVFRGWKNLLFFITFLCLLLLQASFWLVNLGYVKIEEEAREISSVVEADINTAQVTVTANPVAVSTQETEQSGKAAAQAAVGPNQPAEALPQQPQQQQTRPPFEITFKQLAGLIRFLNFVIIPTAALYCLTMLFILKVSLLGRLGGINHISRAFFLSLLFFVLLLPWQKFINGVVVGAIYTPEELSTAFATAKTPGAYGIFNTAFLYLRFTGYWLVVVLLLIFSHIRSARWAKATLRRLEIV